MGEINATLDRKKALAKDAKARHEELAEVEAEQQKRHAELQKQREQRKQLYAQISDKVSAQRKEIGTLQQNERRMSQLIDRLSRILAAPEISLLGLLEVLFGVTWAWLWAAEIPSSGTLIGGILVIGALLLNELLGLAGNSKR